MAKTRGRPTSVRYKMDVYDQINELIEEGKYEDFSQAVNALLEIGLNHVDDEPLISEEAQRLLMKDLVKAAKSQGMNITGTSKQRASFLGSERQGAAKLAIVIVVIAVVLALALVMKVLPRLLGS